MTTFPNHETAKLIRAYAISAMDPAAAQPLIWAIVETNAATAEACCHLGRALILIEDGLSDLPHRVGGDMCDPRKTEIATRLGML